MSKKDIITYVLFTFVIAIGVHFLLGCDAGEDAAPSDGSVDQTKKCVGAPYHNIRCDGGVCVDTYVVTCTWPKE